MSSRLRFQASQGRSSVKGNSKHLLRSSEPPTNPFLKANGCEALETDGRPCRALLAAERDTWCGRHFREMTDLNERWMEAQQKASSINVHNPDTAKQKVIKIRLAVDLRRQVHERFYPKGGDTADFVQWLMKLEQETRGLADSLLMSSMARRPTPDIPGIAETPVAERPDSDLFGRITILQSPLDPKIPMSSLGNMPDDGTILVLKHFYADICADEKRRLYEITPALNDGPTRSPSRPSAQSSETRGDGTAILRAWFRIMIFNDSDAEALEHATRATSIDEFLNGRHASQIEAYCDFFEKAWRPHAVQYLRIAVCAQTLAAGDAKTIKILGGIIPSTTEGLKMTKPCWDILYRWFPDLLTPWTIASICNNYEDYTTICKLLMLGLYREQWYDPDGFLPECPAGIYLGFIPSQKGDLTSKADSEEKKDVIVQSESRNYVTGQMPIGDELTEAFLDELRKRIARLSLVVYVGTNADATVYPSEPDLFIQRRRSAKTKEELDQAEWTTVISLEDIKNDLRLRKTNVYDPVVVDSWQFIIIDKEPGTPFQLFDIIQDVLLMLVGDPSPRQLAKRVIRDVIPPSIQEIFLNELTIESPSNMRFPPPPEVQYEGNRQRTFNPDKTIIEAHRLKSSPTRSRDIDRFIGRVIDDMERCGIITLTTEYETPQTRPLVIQATDGGLDLYFPYDFGALSPDSALTPSLTLPPPTCLLDFANAYKAKHPTAIMAKGSIQTHYCAWPMPDVRRLGRSRVNFATREGHVYHWNAMPFDRPWSQRAWQYYLHHYINSRHDFVMCYLTTFVICAGDEAEAERVAGVLLDETERREWRVVLPSVGEWTSEVESLGLEVLFEGVRPM